MPSPQHRASDLLEETSDHVVRARGSLGKLYRLLRKSSGNGIDDPQYLAGITKVLKDQLEQVENQLDLFDTFLDG